MTVAEVLLEALPYIRQFAGKTVVIKYGGSAMDQADLKEQFALDVILLRLVGIKPVIVHGGGPQIGALMKRLGKKPEFVGGMRVTDAETVEIVEMVLVGKINKEIVGLINLRGGRAVGLSGKDGNMLVARRRAHRLPNGEEVDIGLVGELETVNPEPIRLLEERGFIPVIAPVGVGRNGETYNINADLVAGDVAAALKAEKLIHLTDVEGIKDGKGKLVPHLSRAEAARLISQGVIDGGMLPKVESSLRALGGGTAKSHIIDGRVPHAILLELLTREGVGTQIVLSGGVEAAPTAPPGRQRSGKPGGGSATAEH
jgi:acetylglutamate kinase